MLSGRARDWIGTIKGESAVRSIALHVTREEMEGHHSRKSVGGGIDAERL